MTRQGVPNSVQEAHIHDMARLTVVRHGQASYLAKNYDELSPLGRRQARLLGEYEVMNGDYRKLFELPAAIARVKPADIRAVATELLDARHRTVGVLVPAQSGEEG